MSLTLRWHHLHRHWICVMCDLPLVLTNLFLPVVTRSTCNLVRRNVMFLHNRLQVDLTLIRLKILHQRPTPLQWEWRPVQWIRGLMLAHNRALLVCKVLCWAPLRTLPWFLVFTVATQPLHWPFTDRCLCLFARSIWLTSASVRVCTFFLWRNQFDVLVYPDTLIALGTHGFVWTDWVHATRRFSCACQRDASF